MPSKFRQARFSKESGKVTIGIDRRIARRNRPGRSPDLFDDVDEADRISDDYIQKKYKDRIFNRKSAEMAMNSLLTDPQTGILGDFIHLLGGAGRAGRNVFVDFLMDKYMGENLVKLQGSRVTTRSGKKSIGIRVSDDVYLVPSRNGISARSFKTGRFVKLKEEYFG